MKKRIDRVFDKVIYGILMMLPVFFLVFACIDISSNRDIYGEGTAQIISEYGGLSGSLLPMTNTVLYSGMQTACKYLFFGQSTGNVPGFVLTVTTWWVYVTFLHVLIDIMRWIPAVLVNVLKKAGVDDEEG